jgi:hypothetical protein
MFPSILTGALRRAAVLCLPVLCLSAALLAMPTPSHAQSFFEALFGGGSKPAPVAPNYSTAPQRLAPAGGLPPAAGGQTRSPTANYSRSSRQDDDDDDGRSKGSKGGQRTVCVRLCDGYYWPVSFQTKRSQFQKDARACESSCDGEARLFHFPTYGDIHDAVDNSGKPYARLPAAFLYRKKLVAGCTCRPEAWSDAEVSRHQVYAMEEAQEKARIAEAKAAEEARIAAAEAAKVEAEKRMADAKLPGKPGAKAKKVAVVDATPATADVAVVGSATVASAAATPSISGAAETVVDADPAPLTPKTRQRRNREAASAPVVRTAAAAEPTRRSRPQPLNNPRPQTASASAPSSGGGLFAKKYAWPGD